MGFLRAVKPALLLVFHLGFDGQSLNEQCLFSCKGSECLKASAIYSLDCLLIAPLWTPGGHLFTFDSLLSALHEKQQGVQWSCIRQDWAGIPACPPWAFCNSVPWVVNCGEWHICGIEIGDPIREWSAWNIKVFTKRQLSICLFNRHLGSILGG